MLTMQHELPIVISGNYMKKKLLKTTTTMAKVTGSLFKKDMLFATMQTNFCSQVDNEIYAQRAW